MTWKLPVLNFKEIIDGAINEKHALQNYQNECGPEYNIFLLIVLVQFFNKTRGFLQQVLLFWTLFY